MDEDEMVEWSGAAWGGGGGGVKGGVRVHVQPAMSGLKGRREGGMEA